MGIGKLTSMMPSMYSGYSSVNALGISFKHFKKVEDQGAVDFSVNLFLCKRAVAVSRKNEFSLFGTPVNYDTNVGVCFGSL